MSKKDTLLRKCGKCKQPCEGLQRVLKSGTLGQPQSFWSLCCICWDITGGSCRHCHRRLKDNPDIGIKRFDELMKEVGL